MFPSFQNIKSNLEQRKFQIKHSLCQSFIICIDKKWVCVDECTSTLPSWWNYSYVGCTHILNK